ncbi:hypothetical protein BY458DRAFT_551526 [Sporodiniella umbellata]|nr:hypothetical protein BY458DRAFT_551526 [Sporodiniella umbellata]
MQNNTVLNNEAGEILFQKLLSDKNETMNKLESTLLSLQKHNPKSPCTSKATLAFSLLEDLIHECMYDVLLDTHQHIKKENTVCQICQTKCKHYVKKPGMDIWGKSYTVSNLPFYECVNCRKSIASTRYAPHLEKCLGLAGRQSSRVASRRLGHSLEDAPSPDSAHEERAKKKHLSSSGVSKMKKPRYLE